MRTIYAIILLGILGACSSSVKSFYVVDEDKIDFDTFSFYALNNENLRPKQRRLDRLIEMTIYQVLTEKGFTQKNYPDTYISYKISLGTSATSNIDRHQPYRSYYYPEYNISTTQYKEGLLLIELYTKDDRLLWQGSKTFKVGKSKNTELLLLEMAKEVISAFKPVL